MGRRSGLGRGLGALIPTDEPEASPAEAGIVSGSPPGAAPAHGVLVDLAIEDVRSNRYQPRAAFHQEALDELAHSIQVLGVLQPIIVRRTDEGYELVAGERRWRAARDAGLTTIPALVRDVDHQESLEQALVENLHREDLNAIEEAAAYQQLIDDFHLSHDQVASRVGKSRSAVTNTLRLLQLPTGLLELVVQRQLGAGHARALLALPDEATQIELGWKAARDGWSVRRVEEEVKLRLAQPEPTAPSAPAPVESVARAGADRPAALLELEELLSAHLDTRVSVQLSGRRGRIVIDFGGIEDLERIFSVMAHGRDEARRLHPSRDIRHKAER